MVNFDKTVIDDYASGFDLFQSLYQNSFGANILFFLTIFFVLIFLILIGLLIATVIRKAFGG